MFLRLSDGRPRPSGSAPWRAELYPILLRVKVSVPLPFGPQGLHDSNLRGLCLWVLVGLPCSNSTVLQCLKRGRAYPRP